MTSSGVPRIRRPAYCSLAVCFIQLAFSAFTRIKTTSFFYPWKGTLCAAWLIRFSSGSSDVQRRRDGKDQLLPESNRTILFVHVGKAGGETIKSVLEAGCQVMRNPKRRTKCLATLPATYLSFAVAGYFHCFKVQPMGMAATANSYLFNVRHPVDRSISWYHYVSPHNCRKNNSVSPNCVASVRKPRSMYEKRERERCF